MNKSAYGYLSFIIAVALAVMVVYPAIQNVHNISVQRDAWTKAAQTKEKEQADLTSLTAVFAGQSSRIASLLTTLPANAEVPELLVSLESITSNNAIAVNSLTTTDDNESGKVSITIGGQGGLSSVEGMLQNIADNNRPMSVSSLNMSSANNGAQINFTVVITAPYIANTLSSGGSNGK